MFPKMPVQPFMVLLLQLNRVWRDHEKSKLEDLKKRCAKEEARLRRQIANREPYTEIVQQSKINHLRKKLQDSGKHAKKMEQKAAKLEK